MSREEAWEILWNFQKWRRSEPPYDWGELVEYKPLEYSPQQIGDALDVALKVLGTDYLMDKLEENGM